MGFKIIYLRPCSSFRPYLRKWGDETMNKVFFFIRFPQVGAKKEVTGESAFLIASKALNPCLLPVLTTDLTEANKSFPQSERKQLVTFWNTLLIRKACSLLLLVGGMVASSRNKNRLSCILVYLFWSLIPSLWVGVKARHWVSRRFRSQRYW